MKSVVSLIITIAAVTGGGSRSPAADPLKYIPDSAAIVMHVDVAKLLASPLGLKLKDMEFEIPQDQFEGDGKVIKQHVYKDLRSQVKTAIHIDFDDVTTATLIFPKLKKPQDEVGFILALTLKQPVDTDRVLKGLVNLNQELTVGPEKKPGLYPIHNGDFYLSFPDDKTICVTGSHFDSVPQEWPNPSKTFAPAIAAARTSMAVVAVNANQLPAHINGEKSMPAELAPFAPLMKSDLNVLTLDPQDMNLKLLLTTFNSDKTKAADVADSMKAIVVLLKTLLGMARTQLEQEFQRSKDPRLQTIILPLMTNVSHGLKESKVESTETTTSLQVVLKENETLLKSGIAAFAAARSSASQQYTMNNLKQLSLAMHIYESTHGHFPPAAICDKNGKPLLSWRVAILPHMEQNNVYKQFKLDEAWDSEHNLKLSKILIKTFQIPNQADRHSSHFRVFTGGDKNGKALFDVVKPFKINDVSDGTSNTIMIATAKDAVLWTKPDELTFDPTKNPADQLLFKNDVTPFSFADGSVRTVKKGTDAKIWSALVTRDGGEVASIP
jgi:hypothetical protein